MFGRISVYDSRTTKTELKDRTLLLKFETKTVDDTIEDREKKEK